MPQSKGPFYMTTAIAYTSGKPHIGNTYEIVLADSIARFRRQEGYDVFFQTGTDEHGQKIELKAEEAGITPKEFVDNVSTEIKRIWDLMNTSYDKFIRTTDDYHEKQVQKIFKKLYDQGDIYKGSYEGMYCTPCESFWTESQLVDGKCPDCGREVKPAKEEAYFFKMSKYANKLIEHINTHPEFIQPVSRKNEMMNNFLLPGLQDLCVSRTSFKWGIPVDFDDKHVVYVWLDALTNYITGIGYDADGNSSEQYKKFWPADLHLIGKDIIRFHTIYWPIFLMALGEPLPKQVFGHPWLLQNDGKMSKSKGNVIYADDLVDLFGVDAVRYFVLHEMPFENDGVISWELMVERMNSDLANTLGNLVNRTVAMSNKYFGGVVNKTGVEDAAIDGDLKAVVTATRDKVQAKMATLHVADAITEVFTLFKRCNKYIDETMPWALAKDEAQQDRLAEVLYNLVESITIGANLLKSFMPETTDKILAQLYPANPEAGVRDFDDLATFGLRETGLKVTETPEILFARLDFEKDLKEKVEAIQEAQKKANGVTEYPQVEVKPEITFDDFEKVQFRVAKVLTCEAVKKTKLLKFELQIGDEKRTIVSGIQKYYKPEELIGKKLVVCTNLKPRKICGIESQGMIISAWDDKDNLSVLTLEKDIIEGRDWLIDMKIFETHAHYDDERFDEDRDELISSMLSDTGELDYIVNVGASRQGCEASLALAAQYEKVYAAIGFHPEDIVRLKESDIEWLENMLGESKTRKIVALGEIGLDYYYVSDDADMAAAEKKQQREWFAAQMNVAYRTHMPVMIHSRDACQDTIDILKSNHGQETGGIIHCYSYSMEAARDFLNMGFSIGIGGVLTFKNARKLVEAAAYIPMDRIVLETDSPYMAPEPNRGKRNDSRNIKYVAEKLAQIKGLDTQEVIDVTNQNARRLLFGE